MFTIFVAAVAVSVFVMYFRHDSQLRRRLRGASARPIGELPEDTKGRIVGITRAHGDHLTAPFSGAPCVYYTARVERARDPAPPGGVTDEAELWQPLATETRAVAFVLEDETGRALVEPTAAKVELRLQPRAELGAAELTPGQRAFLTRHHLDAPGSRLRYTEAVIAIGQVLAVFGSGAREPDPAAPPSDDYRGERPTRLRLTSSARHPLLISDDPLTTSSPTPGTERGPSSGPGVPGGELDPSAHSARDRE